MKKIAIATLTFFILTACSSTPAAQPAPAPAPAPVTDDNLVTPIAPNTNDLAAVVQAADPYWAAADASMIYDTAVSICTAFRNGATLSDVADIASTTIGVEHAPAIIAGAIVYVCPDQSYKVQ